MKELYRSAAGFVIFLLMCLGAQLTGSFLTMPAVRSGWYAALKKPVFNPPGWLFAPVWTFLFFTMAVAAWMVWRRESEEPLVKPALLIFFVQLVFNVLWSAIFFSLQRPGAALADIVILWLLILAVVLIFYRIRRPAAWLLVPYLLWVLFAAVLNSTIWWLNRGV